ncbi:MAG: response regulator, partial [Anaerolineae bacterium]
MSDKILIVDDDPSLLELAQYNLEAEGYRVIMAKDGVEGLRLAYAKRPDLLILDVMMPKMDGYQVCQRVREMSDVPIIMLTARGREEDIIKGLDLGADDYLTKPFRIGELLARVRATLRRSRTESFLSDEVTYSDNYLS